MLVNHRTVVLYCHADFKYKQTKRWLWSWLHRARRCIEEECPEMTQTITSAQVAQWGGVSNNDSTRRLKRCNEENGSQWLECRQHGSRGAMRRLDRNGSNVARPDQEVQRTVYIVSGKAEQDATGWFSGRARACDGGARSRWSGDTPDTGCGHLTYKAAGSQLYAAVSEFFLKKTITFLPCGVYIYICVYIYRTYLRFCCRVHCVVNFC